MKHDLVIKGGTLVTASETFIADIGINGEKIVTLGESLDGYDEINADKKLVMPGGIEAHCHIAQESGMGVMTSDDYETGSISAAFGGNSSFVPFAAQKKGESISNTVDEYDRRAETKSVIDYSYHLIITDPNRDVLDELPSAFERGITSFKVFMTYATRVSDAQFLDILTVARRHGGLTMVHAENHDMLTWMSNALTEAGYVEPRFHAPARPGIAEEEAINRAISLSKLANAPLMIVHVSTPAGAELVAKARMDGAYVFSETCPQYIFLTREDLNRPNLDGAKYICSPPLRDVATQEALWRHIAGGTFNVVSSDHAPYRFDESGKFANGRDVDFRGFANGIPGIEMRLPLMFSEGVLKDRISLNQFVALSSTNAARLYGMLPLKGTLSIGADADIAIWDSSETRIAGEMHDAMDYNPFEGMKITGWPTTVISRGQRVIDEGKLLAKPGYGNFIRRGRTDLSGLTGTSLPETESHTNFGVEIFK